MLEWFAAHGDTYRVFSPGRDSWTWVVHHPDDIKRVMVTNHRNYTKGVGMDRVRLLLGNGLITKVQGTGLLFSCELSDDFKCYGTGSTEEWLRQQGLNVIHGGANSLRFTPPFTITSEELELLVSMVGRALREGPRARQAAAA